MKQISFYIEKLTANISITRMRLRRIICIVITFLISILFVSIAILTTIRWSFSLNTMHRVLDSSNYYTNLLQEIDGDAKIITMPTGLPMEVLIGVFQLDEVRAAVNSQLDRAFEGGEFKPDIETIKTRLQNKVDQYLDEKEVVPDKELSEYISDYINSVANEYSNSMKIPLIDYFIRLIIDNQKLYIIAVVILVSITLIALIVLYRLNPSLRGLLFYAYNSAFAAAIMLAAFSKMLITDKLHAGLNIAPNSYGEFITDYFILNFRNLLSMSALFLLLSLALLLAKRVVRIKL